MDFLRDPLNVSYSGGCEASTFTLITSQVMLKNVPVNAEVRIFKDKARPAPFAIFRSLSQLASVRTDIIQPPTENKNKEL